jgi:hypothetical protein
VHRVVAATTERSVAPNSTEFLGGQIATVRRYCAAIQSTRITKMQHVSTFLYFCSTPEKQSRGIR